MSKRAVGIDIGDNSVKVAELELRNGSVMLTSCDVVDIGPEGQKLEEREGAVTEILKRIVAERRLRSKTCVLSVSGQSVFIRNVKLPLVGKSKLDKIVRYEAQQQVPFPIEEIAWDYQVISSPAVGGSSQVIAAEDGIKVRLVAIKSELVEQIIRPALLNKLTPEIIDVGVLAVYNCLDFIGMDLNETFAILDIGSKSTNISVISGRELWTRSVPIAGAAITNEVRKALNINFEKAEEMKIEHGLLGDSAKEKGLEPYEQAVNIAISRMIAEINRSFGYYRTQINQEPVSKIYLLGGGAELRGLDALFSDRFKVEVEKIDVLSMVRILPSFEDQFDVSDLTHLMGTAVGLALRKVRRNPVEINLLPPKLMAEQRARKKSLFYLASAVLGVLSLFSLYWFESSLGRRLVNRGVELKSEIEGVQLYAAKIKAVQKDYGEISNKLAAFAQLNEKRQFWVKLLGELQNALPENIWLVSLSPSQEGLESPSEKPQTEERRRPRRRVPGEQSSAGASSAETKSNASAAATDMLYIVGRTTGTYRDITDFNEVLKKIPYFDPAEIKILTAKPPADGIREFTMQVKFKRGSEQGGGTQ